MQKPKGRWNFNFEQRKFCFDVEQANYAVSLIKKFLWKLYREGDHFHYSVASKINDLNISNSVKNP